MLNTILSRYIIQLNISFDEAIGLDLSFLRIINRATCVKFIQKFMESTLCTLNIEFRMCFSALRRSMTNEWQIIWETQPPHNSEKNRYKLLLIILHSIALGILQFVMFD